MKKATRHLLWTVAGAATALPVSAHGIGIAEVGFAAEVIAFLVLVGAVLVIEKFRLRAFLLVAVLVTAMLLIWVIVFGVLGSVRGAVPSGGDVPLTLLVGLIGAALVVMRVMRSNWLKKPDETQLAHPASE